MQLEYSFLCDAATVSGDGKLNVIGIFDHIGGQAFPVTHRRMYLVVGLRCHVTEVGRHDVEVRLLSMDGADILPPLRMPVEFQRAGTVARLIGELNDVKFEGPGNYTFEVTVDRHHLQTVLLTVLPVGGLPGLDAPPPGPPPGA